jgi:hypothetical protein
MPARSGRHPYLDIFTASLVPSMQRGPGHGNDPPPVEHLLPLTAAAPETRALLDLLVGADHDLRVDHGRAAGINLELAETRLRLAMSRDGPSPALDSALASIARAREEMANGRPSRACAAVTDAVRAVLQAPHARPIPGAG